MPVNDLAAKRIGDTVLLTWTAPRQSTDKLPLRGPIKTWICRAVEQTRCREIGQVSSQPAASTEFEDHLPPQLTADPSELLSYKVKLTNHAGQAAGESNSAYSASGEAPPPLQALTAQVRADGVLLQWSSTRTHPRGAGAASVRIHRELLAASGKPGGPVQRPPGISAAPQSITGRRIPGLTSIPGPIGASSDSDTLVVLETDGPGNQALDIGAAFGRTYRYQAEGIYELRSGGPLVVVAGLPSETVTVSTTDLFPPATPSELVALSVAEEHAIDLSWTPDTEPDLAGYIVYRRAPGEASPRRLSPAIVTAPAFRDLSPVGGRRYAYSVSAIDLSGNESPRSSEVEEVLPSR